MGRKYVRDKAGRFAAKGGGTKGKGGKMGKSAKNLKARAAYKKASGKLRNMKQVSSELKVTTKNPQKRRDIANSRAYWKKQASGAKSGYVRVTNRLAGKGKGRAAAQALGTGPKQARGVKKRRGAKVYDNTTNTSIKMKTVKKNLRRKYPESKAAKSLEKRVAAKAKKNKSEIKMTRRQYSKVSKDFKSSDPKNPRALKFVEGKGTVSMPVKFVKKYNQTDAFTASKAKRGSAATKRDRILRTAERNIRKSAGIKSPSFDRRAKRMKMAEDIMTKSKGGSTAWKQFYSAYR